MSEPGGRTLSDAGAQIDERRGRPVLIAPNRPATSSASPYSNTGFARSDRTSQQVQSFHMNDAQHREELRSKMCATAQQMSAGWDSEHRRSTAISAIEEIPRRIGDEMERIKSYLVDNVQSEVETIGKIICGQRNGEMDRRATKVVKNLEVIPTMIRNLLEARVEKAKATVRHRISGMIQNLSVFHEDGGDQHALVQQMQKISAEVEKIASEAVESAAQECIAHKTRQMEYALAALRLPDREGLQAVSSSFSRQWENTKWQSTLMGSSQQIAELWPSSAQMPTEAVNPNSRYGVDAMAQAVAVVQDSSYIPHSVTNEVVADQLLRAKVRSGGRGQNTSAPGQQTPQSTPARASQAPVQATNPGSVGHPDLCLRPCLYFAAGNCQNSLECGFCHMPHPRRPVRLDKRHRQILRRMPFGDLLDMILPMLQQKASDVMPNNPEIHQLLDELTECARNHASGLDSRSHDTSGAYDEMAYHDGVGSAVGSQLSEAASNASSFDGESRSQVSVGGTRGKPGFAGALQVMGARLLLSLISRLAPPEAVEERAIVDKILALLHEGTDPQPDPFKDDDPYLLPPSGQTPSNASSGTHRRDQQHGGTSRHQVTASFQNHFGDSSRRPQFQQHR